MWFEIKTALSRWEMGTSTRSGVGLVWGLVRRSQPGLAGQSSDWFLAAAVTQCPASAEAGGCRVELAAL